MTIGWDGNYHTILLPQLMSSEDKSELIQSRHEADRATYSRLFQIAQDVFKDPNSRLPFIPSFYRRKRTLQQEINYLQETVPKVFQARGDEFCLEACNKSSNDCLTQCREFTRTAFEIGNALYSGLHKPYTYSKYSIGEEE